MAMLTRSALHLKSKAIFEGNFPAGDYQIYVGALEGNPAYRIDVNERRH